MSHNKASGYFDDFEIISEANEVNLLNETAFPEQNETGNMEQSCSTESEMSAREKPVPRPRNQNKDEMHNKREARWMEEKEELLAKIHDLKENLKQKDEELEEQRKQHEENIKTVENEKELLQSKFDELQSKNAEELTDKEKACEIIKDLQEKSQEKMEENNKRIKELEEEVENLQKSLEEQTESYNAALEKVTAFEQKETESVKTIKRLEEELTTVKEQNEIGNRKIEELDAMTAQLQGELAKGKESFARQKELYKELSAINDDLEKEQNENKMSIRDMMETVRKKKTENEQLVREKTEMLLQLQKAAEELKKQKDMFQSNAQEIQRQKDKLESELIAIKLEQKRLNSEKTSQDSELLEMISKMSSLSGERDFYIEKCKKLEEGLKLKADREMSTLSKALEALNEENEILRKRNEKLDEDVVLLKNIKKDLESEVGATWAKAHGDSNPAMPDWKPSGRGRPTEEPCRQKQILREPMDTTTDASIKQWYDTPEGEQLFGQIYQKLKNEFNAATIDIFREKTNQNISLTLETNRRQKIEVHFSNNFPDGEVFVSYRGQWRNKLLHFNRNAQSDLPTQVAKLLHEVLNG